MVGFDPKQHRVITEMVAGTVTFISIAYILVVNPSMLAQTGMDQSAAFTATALAAAMGTLLCALIARLPYAQAPAMGSNAFFAYTICLTMGYSWQFALTSVLFEGILFVIFSYTGVREWIVNIIPESIKLGIGTGIGCLIAFLGLKNAEIVIGDPNTYIALGDITSGNALLGMIGLVIMTILIVRKVRGALLIGIIATTLIGIPMGITHINHIELMRMPTLSPVFCQFEWQNIFSLDMLVVTALLLSMDIFDTLGTLLTLNRKVGNISKPQFRRALACDAIATVAGACLGTSTVGTYVESASGIQSGGRTGLTSVFTALLLILSIFFAPLFMAIPAAAIGPALFLVGVSMVDVLREMDFSDHSEYIPGIVATLIIPFTFSIANGIILGLACYVIVNLIDSGFRKVNWGMIILTLIMLIKFFL